MKNKKLLCFSLILFSICFSGCNNKVTIDTVWTLKMANENLQCPQELDELTVLDSCKYVKSRIIRYYYTVSEEYQPEEMPFFNEYMKRSLANNLRGSSDFNAIRAARIRVEYYYFDANKKPLMNFILTPDEYGDIPRLHENGYIYSELSPLIEAQQKQLPIAYDDSIFVTKIDLSYPPTISEDVRCATFELVASFDSIQFKQERKDFFIEDAEYGLYGTLFPGAKITYKYIYYGKGDKYLCTLVIFPSDYLD